MKAVARQSTANNKAVSPNDLFDHIRFTDPFAQDRVSEPSGAAVDVESIHYKSFLHLTTLSQQAMREGRGIGAVLWGEPGIGKSHLLARFSRWAQQGDRACYFFLHNLLVSPDRLPRYVLKCVLSRLTAGRNTHFHDTPLYAFMTRVMQKAVEHYRGDSPKTLSLEDARVCYRRFMDELTRQPSAGVDDRLIHQTLFQFFLTVYMAKRQGRDDRIASLAIRWLGGDALDSSEAESLGLGETQDPDTLKALPDDRTIERVLIVLMELARICGQPFILCFDQVENLSDEQVQALSRFSHALIDHASNLLLVTSGVQQDLFEFHQEGIIREASWDRIAQYVIRLQRINATESRQLLETRLEGFFENFITLPPLKRHVTSDALFPLGHDWFEQRTEDSPEFRPRDIITWARGRWAEQRASIDVLGPDQWIECWPTDATPPPPSTHPLEELIDEKVDCKISEQIRRRELDATTLPPDASNLAGLTEVLLEQCLDHQPACTIVGLEHPPKKRAQQPTYQLIVRERRADGKEVATGLVFVVTGSKQSATAAVKRLANDDTPPDHVLLIGDERQTLQFGTKGAEYFDQLKNRGKDFFKTIELTFEQYAKLDALQAVVGEARSGDLEVQLANGQNQTVIEPEVIASHHRKDRYRKHPLLVELLTEASEPISPPSPPPSLDKEDVQQFIVAQLALTMGSSSVEIAKKYAACGKLGNDFSFDKLKDQMEEIAQAMHTAGVIHATPMEEYLYLLMNPAV